MQLHEKKGKHGSPVTCGDWLFDNRLGLASGARVKISQPIAESGSKCARRRHGRSRAPNVEADHPASSPSQQNMSGEGGFNDEAYDSGMQAMCVPVLARPPSAIPGLLRSRAVRFLADAVGSDLSASNRRPSRLRLTRAFRAPFLASSAALSSTAVSAACTACSWLCSAAW